MSRRKKHKSRKRLTYGIIATIFILACFLAYVSLHQSNQTPSDQTSQPKAAIIDHLSFRNETANQTFVNASRSILEEAGFNVDYYPGEDVTVDFYRNLAWQNYGIIILRVHSAIIGNSTELGLFTSEPFNESKYNSPSAPYHYDVLNKRIVRAYFNETDLIHYFAIAPEFIEEYATFKNATIIMMGCDGLKCNTTAEAFIGKGAKVCIGWNGLVSTTHTDHATTRLLQHLAQGDTIKKAVNETMNEVGPEKLYFEKQRYNSTLKYHPPTAENYTIRYALGTSSMNIMKSNTILVKEEKKGTRSNWLWQIRSAESALCNLPFQLIRQPAMSSKS